MPSDLHGADAKYEFIMVRIADNIRLICCKSVQKDKILPAIYVLDFRVNVNQWLNHLNLTISHLSLWKCNYTSIN